MNNTVCCFLFDWLVAQSLISPESHTTVHSFIQSTDTLLCDGYFLGTGNNGGPFQGPVKVEESRQEIDTQ